MLVWLYVFPLYLVHHPKLGKENMEQNDPHGCFQKYGYPPNHPCSTINHLFWGTPIFWKHPHLSVVDFLFFADGSNDQTALVGRMSRRQLPQTAGGLRAQTRKPLAIVAGVSVRCGPALRQQHLNEAVKRSELPDFNGTTIESTS